MLQACVILAAAAAALFGADRLALRMERRGWIYWRKRPAGSGATAGVLTEFQKIVEPQVRT